MKIAVFGATGGLGRAVVKAAIAAGHSVRALVRDPAKAQPPGVEIVVGDLGDADAIRETIRGAEVVLSCVGVVKGGDPEVFRAGLQHIVDAMGTHGVRRLVAISGAGLELEGDVTGIGRRIVIAMLKLFARDVLRGKQLEWEVIRASDVDWTLVRVARMVDRPRKGEAKAATDKLPGSPMVAYADVAAWMLREAVERRFVRGAPFLSGE